MTGNYANFQNGLRKYEAFPEGEYFVINYPDMLGIESEVPYTFASVNEFQEIAENNNCILEYIYKPNI